MSRRAANTSLHHSPEDQKILETEYQKNSKPDRNERLEIVKRVALGEKEVQVGFTHDNTKAQADIAITRFGSKIVARRTIADRDRWNPTKSRHISSRFREIRT